MTGRGDPRRPDNVDIFGVRLVPWAGHDSRSVPRRDFAVELGVAGDLRTMGAMLGLLALTMYVLRETRR